MLLKKSKLLNNKEIQITGSKSESNRLLILQKLFENIKIQNLSNAQDTDLLQKALNSKNDIIDIHHAGTAMRFLTAYFSIQESKTVILTGSERMKQRPIAFLVSALRNLGAQIEYIGNKGFPPLKIEGRNLYKNTIQIPAHISSQFITSLLLIAGKLEHGLELKLTGKIISRPYLEMTLKILSEIGIKNEFSNNIITIHPFKNSETDFKIFEVESDWSSASYFYSLVAIGRKTIHLKSFKSNSLQGDSILKSLYSNLFGIKTLQVENELQISLIPQEHFVFPKKLVIDMEDYPDIAQTLCVTATALKIPFYITGLSTLKVKETDRLLALQNELLKIGCKTEITNNSIESVEFFEPQKNISINTYNDHRMAMSFAPYCLIEKLDIENDEVVEKSYPNFWNDFLQVTIAV